MGAGLTACCVNYMYIVIFKADINKIDSEYDIQARRMRELALKNYGCIKIESVLENDKEITLSYWQSEKDMKDWKEDSEHLLAQADGINKWYKSYSIEIAEVMREYKSFS